MHKYAEKMRILPAALLVAIAAGTVAHADVRVEKINYRGWPNCIRMSNGMVELIATTDIGPRIVRFAFIGKDNLFYENADEMGKTGGDKWMGYGGHRFWLAPEDKSRSYHPDNEPVSYDIKGNTVRLMPDTESTTGVQKEIEITLDADSNHAKVVHKLTNRNSTLIEVSPWGITVLKGDGAVILPEEPYAPHPGIPDYPEQPTDQKYFAPVRGMQIWSFTKLSDPRWTFLSKYVILKANPDIKGPLKIGINNTLDWGAYAGQRQLFVKRAVRQPKAEYPDGGCNFETFTNSDVLELESLGPLARLNPGKSVTHTEDWYLFDNVDFRPTDADIDATVLPLVKSVVPAGHVSKYPGQSPQIPHIYTAQTREDR